MIDHRNPNDDVDQAGAFIRYERTYSINDRHPPELQDYRLPADWPLPD